MPPRSNAEAADASETPKKKPTPRATKKVEPKVVEETVIETPAEETPIKKDFFRELDKDPVAKGFFVAGAALLAVIVGYTALSILFAVVPRVIHATGEAGRAFVHTLFFSEDDMHNMHYYHNDMPMIEEDPYYYEQPMPLPMDSIPYQDDYLNGGSVDGSTGTGGGTSVYQLPDGTYLEVPNGLLGGGTSGSVDPTAPMMKDHMHFNMEDMMGSGSGTSGGSY